MGRRRAVGFYTKGRGRRRKVIPITARSRYTYRGIPAEKSRPEAKLEKKSIGDLEARVISRAKELQRENPNWSAHGSLREVIAEEAEWAPKEKQEKLLELMEKYELYRAEGKIDGFGELDKGGKRRGR